MLVGVIVPRGSVRRGNGQALEVPFW
jgi:hypothetical protein